MAASSFNFGASEFVPKDTFAKTIEQFPTLGSELDDVPKTKGKKNKKKG